MTDAHAITWREAFSGSILSGKGDPDRLKRRIQRHYDATSDQFLKVWGEHIHHGYFKTPEDTNEQAQLNQVKRLTGSSRVATGDRVLDVGCGIGGTARYLARERGCKVTAVTNSTRQVEIALGLTRAEMVKMGAPSSSSTPPGADKTDFIQYPISAGGGAVRILELDAEHMREHFSGTASETFDCIWLSEVLFHLHARQLLFEAASALLDPGGCVVIADIFRTASDPTLSSRRTQKELASIRRNHLCPQLATMEEYTRMAEKAGLRSRHPPIDITDNVTQTWDTSLPIGSVLYVILRGKDKIGYVRGLRSMKKAYAHGTAVYGILCFEKPKETMPGSDHH